jgi:uncharacterized protein (TIGR02646 family)
VTPFPKLPAPAFWLEKEAQWAGREPEWPRLDPLGWVHERRSLREWFHATCREGGELPLCAYCDGPLNVTSRATIDHVAPRSRFQALSVAWHNLLPACDLCNETYKGEQWSCRLVRPDTDPVDDWFDVELDSGKMRPRASVDDPIVRARVRLTILVFRLNTPDRCKARRDVVRTLRNAWKREAATREHDRSTVHERAARGPYRFVARRFLDAAPISARVEITAPPERDRSSE